MEQFNFIQPVVMKAFSDARGSLGVSELNSIRDFKTERIYYIKGVPADASRGAHGHKALEQIFYALSGTFRLTVTNGDVSDSVIVSELSNGYHLPAGLWRDLDNFSSDCICLVLASQPYDESDYIHDFEMYKKWRQSS
jgi:uncharacterized RmlC-like cupin family protein